MLNQKMISRLDAPVKIGIVSVPAIAKPMSSVDSNMKVGSITRFHQIRPESNEVRNRNRIFVADEHDQWW